MAADQERNVSDGRAPRRFDWRRMLGKGDSALSPRSRSSTSNQRPASRGQHPRSSMGVLNDRQSLEVPGSILLLTNISDSDERLDKEKPSGRPSESSAFDRPNPDGSEKKRTPDGRIILEPQPDDSPNDPLNWKVWRRDAALISLGFYCMLGGGMTPILAAGFTDIAHQFNVSIPQVALTTGLYMLGLGVGSVLLAPTAIIFGKRPVYLGAAIVYLLTSVWCALSPSFPCLVIARVFMGLAVSSVECLPSASIGEIYFLHEKAFRLGIYTLLLLSGKNLVPLVSAAIIGSLGWRWVFWIVAIIVGFAAFLMFFLVPESFWDRNNVVHKESRLVTNSLDALRRSASQSMATAAGRPCLRAKEDGHESLKVDVLQNGSTAMDCHDSHAQHANIAGKHEKSEHSISEDDNDSGNNPARNDHQAFRQNAVSAPVAGIDTALVDPAPNSAPQSMPTDFACRDAAPGAVEAQSHEEPDGVSYWRPSNPYTAHYQHQPPQSFTQQLRLYSGRLTHDPWLRVAVRPFILFAYPAILWSALVYSLSIGWLIVLSESVTSLYENRATYNFTALQTGLVYVSPFVGGILGTAVAGKASDLIVRVLARKNGGVYEPEFRLVMGLPITLFTTIGLMGYGWSIAERDAWIVPTIFFGFISFGCSLGSTTAITFAVDSYKALAGEALVTLNFSKNVFHGLVFSLFFNRWLQSDGSKDVFVAIGGIQLGCMLTTIPMYIYGKRARMWTVRRGLMERFGGGKKLS